MRTAADIEAKRALHEAIGRFVVQFERVIAELRRACQLMLERRGLKSQSLANVLLARVNASELTDLVGAMYREFRPDDTEGTELLGGILKRIDTLRAERNRVIHSSWSLGYLNEEGETEPVAHSIAFERKRNQGQTVREMHKWPSDFDDLTTEATELQVYAIRLCQSVNQTNLPLATMLRRSLQ